jgi:hypothetical protein
VNLSELAHAYRRTIHAGDLMEDLTKVAAFDRLQGSEGLAAAAQYVSTQAEQLGLDVTVERYQPGHRWWSFTAPRAASPVHAVLSVVTAVGHEIIASYPEHPLTLARGSASTPDTGINAPAVLLDAADPAAAFVLCPPQQRFAIGPLIDRLAAAGAIGFAIAGSAPANSSDVIHRLEVPDDCPLVALSLSPRDAQRLHTAIAAKHKVHVSAQHRPPAPMPVVHARHRGQPGGPRALLIAHLCHPAPSASDNASGVAGLLGIAAAVNRLWPPGTGPNIDLLWAPEMVGTAAYLHDIALPTHGQKPDLVLSLDMIGGTGHLILEDAADHAPAPLAAALTAASQNVRPDQLSYSHAVALPTWPRAVTPFVGASDHLLFADRSIAVPAGHVCCWPDPVHHTSYDTIDRVNPAGLADVTVVVAAAVTALCLGGDAIEEIAAVQADHTAKRLARTPHEPGAAAYRQAVSAAAIATMTGWHTRPRPPIAPAHAPAATRDETPIMRSWAGPWNLQNLIAALPAERHTELAGLLDPAGPGYARLVGLAHAVDDATGLTAMTTRARWATGLDILPSTATTFVELMCTAGWVRPAPSR